MSNENFDFKIILVVKPIYPIPEIQPSKFAISTCKYYIYLTSQPLFSFLVCLRCCLNN